jgi:hypothetical protein
MDHHHHVQMSTKERVYLLAPRESKVVHAKIKAFKMVNEFLIAEGFVKPGILLHDLSWIHNLEEEYQDQLRTAPQ